MADVIITNKGGGLGQIRGFGPDVKKILTGAVLMSDDYAEGGEEFDVTKYFRELQGVIFESKSGYTFTFDSENNKVIAYSAAETEVSDDTDLSAIGPIFFCSMGPIKE